MLCHILDLKKQDASLSKVQSIYSLPKGHHTDLEVFPHHPDMVITVTRRWHEFISIFHDYEVLINKILSQGSVCITRLAE